MIPSHVNCGAAVICHDTLKSHKTVFIVEFLKNYKVLKLRLCFIPKVTCSVLSVCALSVFSLLHNVIFTA